MIFTLFFALGFRAFADSQIKISEVFPNPKGSDSGKEWLELYNISDNTVTLDDWRIKVDKKETIIEDLTIGAKKHLSINLSLKNSPAEILLINNNSQVLDRINYEDVKENLSYTHISVKSPNKTKTEWIWTNPTKDSKNPTFLEIYGEIASPPQINKELFFEVETKKHEKHRIFFDPKVFDFELLSTILPPKTDIALLVEEIGAKKHLRDFETKPITQKPKNKTWPNWEYYLLIPIFLITVFLPFIKPTPEPT